MGSEARGPGAEGPGLPHVAAPDARAWAVAAATAAVRVPAGNAEADAWTVRGWADVAIGCVALDGPGFAGPARRLARPDGPGAFGGLDEVIRSLRVVSGGQHAARLRQLRRFAGPVPPWYPDTRPVAGPIRDVRKIVWRAARLVTGFGELLMATAATLRHDAACPLVSARQLAWGARYRPSPSADHVTLRLPLNRRLARRTWMCLPGLPGPGTAIAEVPSTATAMEQQIWRGIHEGAHLDHLSSVARLRHPPGRPLAPVEFPLDRGVSFHGQVLDPDGKGLPVDLVFSTKPLPSAIGDQRVGVGGIRLRIARCRCSNVIGFGSQTASASSTSPCGLPWS